MNLSDKFFNIFYLGKFIEQEFYKIQFTDKQILLLKY